MPDFVLNVTVGFAGVATLSLPTASANGATAYNAAVTTDTAQGTIYRFVHLSAQEPDAATIKSAGIASTPSQAGAQSLPGSGLTQQTTYRVSFVQETSGGFSNVVRSASFTTGSLGSGAGTATISIIKSTSDSDTAHGIRGITFQCTTTGSTQTDNASNRTLYDPSYHNLVYVWDFGDPGRVSDKVVNLPSIWNDLNRAYGKEVSHVFFPGSYTVSVSVYELDGTLVATATQSVTVAANGFTGSSVILVAPTSEVTAAYPGATTVANWNAAMTEIDNGNNDKMVVLSRGQTYAASAGLQMTDGNAPNVFITAAGTGARPIVNFSASGSYNGGRIFDGTYSSFADDFVLQGIDFRGPWNVDTETGTKLTLFDIKQESQRTAIVDDCIISGFSRISLRVDNGPYNFGFYIHNTRITNYGDYGTFCGDNTNGKIGILGCAIDQSPQARSGYTGNKGDANANTHGPIRIAHGAFVHISCCDLFNRTGHGPNNADQPCIRLGTSSEEGVQARFRFNVERTAMEGGYQMVLIRGERDQSNAYGVNCVFDKCLMVATAVTWSFFAVNNSGPTLRNILAFKPNAPGLSSFPWQAAISAGGGTFVDNRSQWPTRFYANTYVNLLNNTNRNGNDLLADEGFQTEFGSAAPTHDNFINDAPNASGQGETGANLTTNPIATVGGTWTSRYLGSKSFKQPTMDATYATPAGSVYDAVPGSGSSALGDGGTGLQAYDDWAGGVRSDPADRGAREA